MSQPLPWQGRLDQDVLMFRRFGANWRLLNRFRVMARASGRLYGGVYWFAVPSRFPYLFGKEFFDVI